MKNDMTIWIVRKHQRSPYDGYSARSYLRAFEIFSTHWNRAEAKAVADQKNAHPNTWMLYTVGKVTLKDKS